MGGDMKGAFQTSREIFENPIWQDIPKFRIFFYIVGNAVYAEEGAVVAGMHLKRGQFLRAYRNLMKDLEYIENRSVKRYSLSVISRKVEQLVKEERLKIEDTELGTLFTVVNYAQYQGFDHYKKKTWDSVGTDLERDENRDGTELEQGWNNNNKDNKDKKVKKENKKDNTAFEDYTSNPVLLESLNSFYEYRKKSKKPMTDAAIKLLLNKLNDLASDDETKVDILNQSILNGWQGIFPIKDGDKGGRSSGISKHERDSKPGYGGSDRKITSLDKTSNVREFSDEELARLI
ncbi:hypothetical protein ACFQ3W_25605 [Paenibacillus puldeungensis]|uniref:Uncharacterized protein n=1 Tax=Paenibacillus puldeungensis TaxID=696536 RepID=A0ABW3S4T7_9BACL